MTTPSAFPLSRAKGGSGSFREWLGLLRSFLIYWRPGRQRGLRRFYRPFVDPGDLVFDVGAHLGDRTAAFSALGATVVALEPHPRLCRWLRRLVGRRDGVTVLGQAAGSGEGTATLKMSRLTPTVSTVAGAWSDDLVEVNAGFRRVRWEDRAEVPVTTLDHLIDRYGLPRFCKIDVEGHEREVLAGLSRPIPALSVEFVAGSLDVALACLGRVERLGDYEYNAVVGERRSFVFPRWRDAEALEGWLSSGAGGAASGDLYARLKSGRAPALRSEHEVDG